jgi:hypothetical protein
MHLRFHKLKRAAQTPTMMAYELPNLDFYAGGTDNTGEIGVPTY